jgi:hypothetical protein
MNELLLIIFLNQWFWTFLGLRHLLAPNFQSRHTKKTVIEIEFKTPTKLIYTAIEEAALDMWLLYPGYFDYKNENSSHIKHLYCIWFYATILCDNQCDRCNWLILNIELICVDWVRLLLRHIGEFLRHPNVLRHPVWETLSYINCWLYLHFSQSFLWLAGRACCKVVTDEKKKFEVFERLTLLGDAPNVFSLIN